ncbi:MAG TPA: hypothetical protein PKE31_19505 [Pseudomonadota bacterium]|nr:hypothetical protein [Pseudomonadota bacterium]
MRTFLAASLATATLVCASPQDAEAQVFFRPWLRPRVVVVPPRVVLPVVAPPVVYPPQVYPPQVYVQPYPQTYYYPPPPPQVYVQPAPPPQVYVQPAPPPPVIQQPPMVIPQEAPPLPPPPVYVQPPVPVPAPVVVQQAPVAVQPPPVVAPLPQVQVAVPRKPPRPEWKTHFGLGLHFVAGISTEKEPVDGRFTRLGFGGDLLYRNSRRVVLELSGEYQKRMSGGFERYDIPVLFGTRLHMGAPDWAVSPYFVAAVGGSYSKLDFIHSQDTAWFVNGQLGGGLELRLGQRFVLNADVRGDGRYRLTKPDAVTLATQCVNGEPVSPMGHQYGLQGRLGAALYF